MPGDAVANNEKLFPVFTRKLSAAASTESYIMAAGKLASWLSSEKAYYPVARPKVVDLLETACTTIEGKLPGFSLRYLVLHPDSCPPEKANLLKVYTQLVGSVSPYYHLFPEADLQERLRTLFTAAGIDIDQVPSAHLRRSRNKSLTSTSSSNTTSTSSSTPLAAVVGKHARAEKPSASTSTAGPSPSKPTSAASLPSSSRPLMTTLSESSTLAPAASTSTIPTATPASAPAPSALPPTSATTSEHDLSSAPTAQPSLELTPIHTQSKLAETEPAGASPASELEDIPTTDIIELAAMIQGRRSQQQPAPRLLQPSAPAPTPTPVPLPDPSSIAVSIDSTSSVPSLVSGVSQPAVQHSCPPGSSTTPTLHSLPPAPTSARPPTTGSSASSSHSPRTPMPPTSAPHTFSRPAPKSPIIIPHSPAFASSSALPRLPPPSTAAAIPPAGTGAGAAKTSPRLKLRKKPTVSSSQPDFMALDLEWFKMTTMKGAEEEVPAPAAGSGPKTVASSEPRAGAGARTSDGGISKNARAHISGVDASDSMDVDVSPAPAQMGTAATPETSSAKTLPTTSPAPAPATASVPAPASHAATVLKHRFDDPPIMELLSMLSAQPPSSPTTAPPSPPPTAASVPHSPSSRTGTVSPRDSPYTDLNSRRRRDARGGTQKLRIYNRQRVGPNAGAGAGEDGEGEDDDEDEGAVEGGRENKDGAGVGEPPQAADTTRGEAEGENMVIEGEESAKGSALTYTRDQGSPMEVDTGAENEDSVHVDAQAQLEGFREQRTQSLANSSQEAAYALSAPMDVDPSSEPPGETTVVDLDSEDRIATEEQIVLDHSADLVPAETPSVDKAPPVVEGVLTSEQDDASSESKVPRKSPVDGRQPDAIAPKKAAAAPSQESPPPENASLVPDKEKVDTRVDAIAIESLPHRDGSTAPIVPSKRAYSPSPADNLPHKQRVLSPQLQAQEKDTEEKGLANGIAQEGLPHEGGDAEHNAVTDASAAVRRSREQSQSAQKDPETKADTPSSSTDANTVYTRITSSVPRADDDQKMFTPSRITNGIVRTGIADHTNLPQGAHADGVPSPRGEHASKSKSITAAVPVSPHALERDNPGSPPTVKDEDDDDDMVDELGSIFGLGACVVAADKGQAKDNAAISLKFMVTPDDWAKLDKWNGRYRGEEEVSRDACMCISLACYLFPDICQAMETSQVGFPQVIGDVLPCSWPNNETLRAVMNETINLPLAPPLIMVHDFIDLTRYTRLGENHVEIVQDADMSTYMFVIHAHYPVASQLLEMRKAREADRAFEHFLVHTIEKPLYLPRHRWR